MAQSLSYEALASRIEELRATMLPETWSPTGDYTPAELDRTRGYRLLVHAEIEAFLENRASELVRTAFADWRSDQKPRHTIIALLSFCRVADKSYQDISKSLEAAFRTFTYIVKNNHGVKEENIYKLLLPTGIEKDQLDSIRFT